MEGSRPLARARPSPLPLLVLALASSLPRLAAADGLYLHRVPTALAAPGAGRAEGPLRVRVFVPDPDGLAARLAPAVHSLGADHVELSLSAYPELAPRTPAAYRAASFLIDFDQPAVRALHAELAARRGEMPGPVELRAFTTAAIPRKSMERGWDVASRVARAGVGDCTEHAVLLTALARATGWPARVVLGLVVVEEDGAPQAFGHAWAELHEAGRWTPVEATPVAEEMRVLGYLPLLLLPDEGPGYALGLGRALQRSWVRRIELHPGAGAGRKTTPD